MRAQDKHNPGGRVKHRLPEDVAGDAVFSECGKYRQSLSRDWTPAGENPRSVMFCGMNPSTADGEGSDPTVTREMNFARDWGYTRYLKVNMLDYRATNPMDLPRDPREACSDANLHAIASLAKDVDEIILAFGNMPARYQGIIDSVIDICRESGKTVSCLGHNANGSAKHPLYLARNTKRQPF